MNFENIFILPNVIGDRSRRRFGGIFIIIFKVISARSSLLGTSAHFALQNIHKFRRESTNVPCPGWSARDMARVDHHAPGWPTYGVDGVPEEHQPAGVPLGLGGGRPAPAAAPPGVRHEKKCRHRRRAWGTFWTKIYSVLSHCEVCRKIHTFNTFLRVKIGTLTPKNAVLTHWWFK